MLANRVWQALKGILYDRTTPVQVVNAAYTTSASARPQILSDGTIVTAEISGNVLYLQKSVDNGATFSNVTSWDTGLTINGFSINTDGIDIQVIISYSTVLTFRKYSTSGSIITGSTTIDSSQTAMGACSLTRNPSNGHLTASWSSKNATYPNSFNIRSAKSTNGGATWTKQDGTAGVDQLSTYDVSTVNIKNPSISYMNNGKPIIIFETDASTKSIGSAYYTTSWNFNSSNVYASGTTYAQSSPSATTHPSTSPTPNRIEVSWYGLDSTDTGQNNIRYSYSDDYGVTWSSMLKLTSGNTYSQAFNSITVDKNGNVHVMWSGRTSTSSGKYGIRKIVKTLSSWGSITNEYESTTNDYMYPSTCNNYYDFEKPLTIWYNNGVDVKFYGKWTVTVSTPTITFKTPILFGYTNPRIYRSNNNGTGFGTAGVGSTTYDRTTPVQVVNSDYTTSASARPQVLQNNWVVTLNFSSSVIYLQVDKLDGNGFVPLCYITEHFTMKPSMCSYGNNIFVGMSTGASTIKVVKIDATTVTNTDRYSTAVLVDSLNNLGTTTTLAVNPSNGNMTIAHDGKVNAYPNSSNIRSAKSTDGGATWTKQDGTAGVDQISTLNTSTQDYTEPCVIYMNNSNPIIFHKGVLGAGSNFINTYRWTGSSWSSSGVYSVGAYAQSSPSATTHPSTSTTPNRIEVAWSGRDATDTSAYNLRYSYSDDYGVTWSSMLKLTTGNAYAYANPCISVDKDGKVYVLFHGVDSAINVSYYQIRMIIKTSSTWGSIASITNQTTVSASKVSTCNNYYDFEKPLSIWSVSGVDVKFFGKWTV